jgi:hypothetical protein
MMTTAAIECKVLVYLVSDAGDAEVRAHIADIAQLSLAEHTTGRICAVC